MKTTRILLLFFSIAFLLTACSEDDNDKNSEETLPPQEALMPLDVENYWKFAYTTSSRSEEATMQYPYKHTLDGYTGYSIEANLPDTTALISADTDGNVELAVVANGKVVLRSVRYKKSVQKGDEWSYKTLVTTWSQNGEQSYQVEEYVMKCVAVDTVITTPAGQFTCNVYSWSPTDGKDVFIEYMSIGVGFVKMLRYEMGKLFSTQTLIAYNVKK